MAARKAPINPKLQHPPPPLPSPDKPQAFELLKIGSCRSNFRPLWPKWPKQSSSARVVFNKVCVQTCQHMFRDPLYDDDVFTRPVLLQNTTLM